METLVWSLHIIAAAVMIVLIMLQQGKGADMGAAFGGGASGSVFGASGSANFLSRMTAMAATVFFMTSLSLAYLSGDQVELDSVMQKIELDATEAAVTGEPGDGVRQPETEEDDAASRARKIPE
ncbi:preprotein translocase subunit SecG [Nitrosomonas halophila]|uniref:Protein-export membrane protein SecG n=1 Tax=Nitrosomonas halophila TaxID=44576 RepID=A0A1H3CHF6_9PROT|nr:preprotein translocase subunit SecG [Nitrosomonas halophila]SDX52919.1 preprotein translocase subunit SecG [Nitrosomonas halophila]